ncbi:MAG: M48 family metallopeptidase [Myxococcota bacterium]
MLGASDIRVHIARRLAAVGLAVLAGCAAPSIDYVTGRPTLNHYSLEQDVILGTKLATMVIASAEVLGGRVDPDDVYTRALWRVADRILAVPENRARMPPLPWELHMVGSEGDGHNAWCFPGGQVVALTGLLRDGFVRDEDELAAVLGHEMGHAAARHATEQATVKDLEDRLPFGEFLTDRMVDFNQVDTPRDVWQSVAGPVPYSVLQETEADIIGLEMMARAGYDPGRAPAIWRRIADRPQSPDDTRTHPPFAAREKVLLDHLRTAAYVSARLPRRAPPERRWAFEGAVHARTGTVSLEDLDPLPEGPRVRGVVLPAKAEVLDAGLRVRAGPSGEALRAEAWIRPSRDLLEDRLPFSATLKILRVEETRLVELEVRPLAYQTNLERPLIPMRVALAPLPPGRYEARLSVVVGALERFLRHRFDISPGKPVPSAEL